MIRSVRAAIVALLVAAASQAASAQVHFTVAGGGAFPQGNNPYAGGQYGSGYVARAGLEITPLLLPVGFRIEGLYSHFSYAPTLGSSNSYNVTAATASIVRDLVPGPVAPYLVVGAGMYHLDPGSGGTNKAGANGGFGVRGSLMGASAFAEASYHYISGNEGFEFVPIVVGFRF